MPFTYSSWVYDEALRRERFEFVWPSGSELTCSATRSRSTMGGTDPQDQKEHFYYEGEPVPLTSDYRVRPNGSLYTSKAFAYLAFMAFKGIDDRRDVRTLSQNNVLSSQVFSFTPAERVAAHLRDLLEPGNAPTLRGTGHAGHTDGSLAVALAFVRHTPAVWDALGAAEQEKLTWIMRGYLVAGNFAQNAASDNDDNSGLLGWGSYTKVANPNLQEGYLAVMIAGYYFFGHGLTDHSARVAAVNAQLTRFDFERYVAAFDAQGLTNARDAWAWAVLPRAQKEAYFSGGAMGGTDDRTPAMINAQASLPFEYRAVYPRIGDELHRPDDPYTVRLLDDTDSAQGGAIIPYDPVELYFALSARLFYHLAEDESQLTSAGGDERGYTLGSPFDPDAPGANQTPVSGEVGMSFEFRARPERHSLKYVLEGAMSNLWSGVLIASMGDLERMAPADRTAIFERMQIGWADFLYKASVGYRSYEGDKSNAVTGLNYGHQLIERGFNLVVDVWRGYLGPVSEMYSGDGSSPPPPAPPPPPPTGVELVASDDAYTRGGGRADTNYGGELTLVASDSGDGHKNTYDTFLKFDLSDIATPDSVHLRLFVTQGAASAQHQLRYVADDDWSEATLTYNNGGASRLDGPIVAQLPAPVTGQTVEIEITDLVLAEADGTLSLHLEGLGDERNATYGSTEQSDAARRPVLVVR